MHKFGYGTQCLLALILGALFGNYAPIAWTTFIEPVGQAFIQLLYFIVTPLIFLTLLASFSRLESYHQAKNILSRTLFWFLLTAAFASLVGLAIGLWFDPGALMTLEDGMKFDQVREVPPFADILLNMLPGDILQQIINHQIIPVIIASVIVGFALVKHAEQAQRLRIVIQEASQVMFQVTRWILRLAPFGIFALIAQVTATYGWSAISPLVWFIVAIYVACFVQLIIYGLIIWIYAGMTPWKFYQAIYPMQLTAFSTSSSLATLPVTINTLNMRLKIPESLTAFIAPLGTTMKMDGCGAIYPMIVAIFTATVFQIDLTLYDYIVLLITATIATIGTAGVPGTASITATVVLASIGLPLEGLAIVIGIDKIIDVIRTTINVTGSAVTAVCVEKGIAS